MILKTNYEIWLEAEDSNAWLQLNKDSILPEKWDQFIEALNLDCQRMRESEYPKIEEIVVAQIEFEQFGDSTELDAIKAARAAVKAKYPKVTDTTS